MIPSRTTLILTLLLVASVVTLVPGVSRLGFWEQTGVSSKKHLPSVRRESNTPVPTELTLLFALESDESTRWPPLSQWIFRGSARLPLPRELGARLPALLFSLGLLALFVLVPRRKRLGRHPWLAPLLLLGAPGFLLAARSLSLDVTWIFFSSLTILVGGRLTSTDEPPSLAWGGVFLVSLAGSHLSRGVLLGVLYPVAAVLAGALLAGNWRKTHQRRLLLGLGLLGAGALAATLYALATKHGVYSSLLYATPNPASSTPSAKHAHALFTHHVARAVFSAFPWVVLLIPALPMLLLDKSGVRRARPELALSVGWLLAALCAGAYHEMRVGSLLFPGLFPAAHLSAWLLTERRRELFAPLGALLVGLSALLLYRDLLQYPQYLPELITYYEIPSSHVAISRPFLIALLPFLWPLATVFGRSLTHLPRGVARWWPTARRSGFLFSVVAWLLFPLTWGIARCARLPFARWWHGFSRPFLRRVSDTAALNLPNVVAAFSLGVALLISHSIMPSLSMENSTRYLYTSYDALARPHEPLGVFHLSSRAAPVYIGASAVNLTTEAALAQFMREPGRRFVALPSGSLGSVDALLRRNRVPYSMPVPAAPHYMLLANRLGPTEKDHNPLAPFISSRPIPMAFSADTVFDNSLELVGYSFPRKIRKGQTVTFRLLFKVTGQIKTNYRIFIHLDPPYGTRMVGDHKPVKELLPTTHWTVGTYILDEYDVKVPRIGFPAGLYRIYAGLFLGSRRMKITAGKTAGKNRAPLGTMEIHPPRFFSCGK